MSRRPLTWVSLLALALVLLGWFVIDQPLARFLKQHTTGHAEGFWKVVTDLGMAELYLIPSGLLVVGLLLASLRFGPRLRQMAWTPGFVFLAMAVSGILNSLIKWGIGRARPRLLFDEGFYGFIFFSHKWAYNSFPSGHTQAAFAAMVALTLVMPRYDVAFLSIALLVACSRVATTVHYFSDAVAGAWLAVTVTVLIHRALEKRGIEVRLRLERDKRL
jgi:membrane-associated phospholipid phosphatase